MSHIQNIEIQNFKSIKHCVIDGCKRINVFVGAPNVGKSNILEAMGLCSLIEGNSRSQFLDDYVRYEKVNSLFYQKKIDEGFVVMFNNQEFGITGFVDKTSSLESFLLSHYNSKHPDFGFHSTFAALTLKFFIDKDFNLKKYEDENLNKIGAKSRGSTWSFDNITNKAIDYLKNGKFKKYAFKDKVYLRDYNSNELHIPFGENIGTFLAFQNGKLYEAIQSLVTPNSFYIEGSNIRYKKNSVDGFPISFSYNEIADTLQRLIFHLTAIMSNKDSVLLFEEPESHCYEPYIQEITNAIKYDKQNNQYFIVTHSQYIVSEFLRDEESRNSTNIYMVGLDEGGSTKVKLLDNDKNEDVYQYGTNVFFNYEALWQEN
jgi:AAA15 family ATPase/GTPase